MERTYKHENAKLKEMQNAILVFFIIIIYFCPFYSLTTFCRFEVVVGFLFVWQSVWLVAGNFTKSHIKLWLGWSRSWWLSFVKEFFLWDMFKALRHQSTTKFCLACQLNKLIRLWFSQNSIKIPSLFHTCNQKILNHKSMPLKNCANSTPRVLKFFHVS